MSTDTRSAIDEIKAANASANGVAEHSQKAFADAIRAAERSLGEAAKTAERVLREGVETLRAQTRVYGETAGQQVEDAQRYVVERVKERPMTATLAGLGVGLLLGLLLSNRSK